MPKDLLDAASVINKSTMFIGTPSCPYVIADGLKVPRLTLGIYRHILPLGNKGCLFQLNEEPEKIFEQIQVYI